MVDTPRGIKNCNPGNIRHSATVWQGQADVQTDTAFVVFKSAYFGIRALARVLYNYQAQHGLKTVTEIINRWAPNNENDTEAYINSVSQDMRVGTQDQIDLSKDDTLVNLTKAIIKHENGMNPYTNAIIYEAIEGARS